VPQGADVKAFLRAQAPDVVLITPLVDLGSPQIEHLLAARALGLRTVLCVGSWDHLSSKSILRTFPDLITVWNETQKQEAVELHGVPPARVVVTGAQCYDQWFGRAPSRSREAFCEQLGLDPARPIVLYVASSLFRKTADEPKFIEQWIAAVRGSDDPAVRGVSIIVRPHPARADDWHTTDLTEFKDVVLFGSHPVDASAKNDYFDSFHHAAVVVGLNTSALLEAGVAGKPVLTILVPEISRDNQEGTIHFRYLLNVGGGLVQPGRGLDEHLAQLSATLADDRAGVERARRFTQAFIRPYGLEVPATPRFADAIEAAGRLPAPSPAGERIGALLPRLALIPLLAYAEVRSRTQPFRKETSFRFRRFRRHFRKRIFVSLRQFAIDQLRATASEEPPKTRASIASATLTPKRNKPRDPAKSLSFPGVVEVDETKEMLTMLGRQDRPIIVGPWLTETGFELLYWIPFLAWAKAYGSLHEDQLVVVSRGGAAPWYRHITSNYHDILDLFSPEEFRVRNESRVHRQQGRMKHVDISEFDREIIDRVKEARGLGKVQWLHPSLMYNLFKLYWRQNLPMTLVEAFSIFKPLPKVPLGELAAHLPREYVAAKFYGSAALPDNPRNRAFIAATLAEMTRTTDVVLLNTPDRYDEHDDFAAVRHERLHTVEHLMTPATNLEVQTRIIGGAKAFTGTYGGFSYLAPFLGVDTVSFYSNPSAFRFDHMELAHRVFASFKRASFVPLDVKDVDVVRLGLARLPVADPEPEVVRQ
jgi:hypothetical protein